MRVDWPSSVERRRRGHASRRLPRHDCSRPAAAKSPASPPRKTGPPGAPRTTCTPGEAGKKSADRDAGGLSRSLADYRRPIAVRGRGCSRDLARSAQQHSPLGMPVLAVVLEPGRALRLHQCLDRTPGSYPCSGQASTRRHVMMERTTVRASSTMCDSSSHRRPYERQRPMATRHSRLSTTSRGPCDGQGEPCGPGRSAHRLLPQTPRAPACLIAVVTRRGREPGAGLLGRARLRQDVGVGRRSSGRSKGGHINRASPFATRR